jgi:hypothetical protein
MLSLDIVQCVRDVPSGNFMSLYRTQLTDTVPGIEINHHLDEKISPVYYPDVYLQLDMLRASSRPSSGAQKLQ